MDDISNASAVFDAVQTPSVFLDGLKWLFEQAKTASPFVAMFCLLMYFLERRRGNAQEKNLLVVLEGYRKATTAAAKASTKLAAAVENGRRRP